MNGFQLIQESINYIEAQLLTDINYVDVAAAIHMSCYNFHRNFSLMAGMTANTYIRNRRLSLAGQELQTTDCKVIDVCYKYGYDTPESFTKAFTRFHGVTPTMAKSSGTQLLLFNPLVIKVSLEGGTRMSYRIEKKAKQRFIALISPFPNELMNDDELTDIPDFWHEAYTHNLVTAIRDLRPSGKKDLYGLCSPTVANESTFDYGIGVLVDGETSLMDEEQLLQAGFRFWDVAPATYVVFKCYGDNGDSISDMWTKFVQEFSPQTGYEQTDATDYELYFEKAETGLFCELWIPVKKSK